MEPDNDEDLAEKEQEFEEENPKKGTYKERVI